MTDIALTMDGNGVADIAMSGADLTLDEGLETACIISLFTDRYVEPDEVPDGQTDQRGWWGDVANTDGDYTGSKLWLLAREKTTADLAERARLYCEEALAWMLEDGVTTSLEVETEIISPGVLGICLNIERPQGNVVYRYDYLWQQQALKN